MTREECLIDTCLCKTCKNFYTCCDVTVFSCQDDIHVCFQEECSAYEEGESYMDPKKMNLETGCEDARIIPEGNVGEHHEICTELNKLYERKNHDYGDSFHQTFLEEGFAMVRIRLADKFNRFKTLSKSEEAHVKNESIRDTLMDLANYSIMTIMEIDRSEKKED